MRTHRRASGHHQPVQRGDQAGDHRQKIDPAPYGEDVHHGIGDYVQRKHHDRELEQDAHGGSYTDVFQITEDRQSGTDPEQDQPQNEADPETQAERLNERAIVFGRFQRPEFFAQLFFGLHGFTVQFTYALPVDPVEKRGEHALNIASEGARKHVGITVIPGSMFLVERIFIRVDSRIGDAVAGEFVKRDRIALFDAGKLFLLGKFPRTPVSAAFCGDLAFLLLVTAEFLVGRRRSGIIFQFHFLDRRIIILIRIGGDLHTIVVHGRLLRLPVHGEPLFDFPQVRLRHVDVFGNVKKIPVFYRLEISTYLRFIGQKCRTAALFFLRSRNRLLHLPETYIETGGFVLLRLFGDEIDIVVFFVELRQDIIQRRHTLYTVFKKIIRHKARSFLSGFVISDICGIRGRQINPSRFSGVAPHTSRWRQHCWRSENRCCLSWAGSG